MYKLLLLAVSIGGFIFAGSGDNAPKSDVTSDQNNQYYWEEGNDDFKGEAGRRRGKGQRGRRRGGGGLR